MAVASGCSGPAPLIAELSLEPGCFTPQPCAGDVECEEAVAESALIAVQAGERIRVYPAVVHEIREAPEQTEWQFEQVWAPPHEGATRVDAAVFEQTEGARHLSLDFRSAGTVRFDDGATEIDWQDIELLHFDEVSAAVTRVDADIGDRIPIAWTADAVRVNAFARACDPQSEIRFEASNYEDPATWRCWNASGTPVDCAGVRVDVP